MVRHLILSCREHVMISLNPNLSLDCYALAKPSFCHLFRHFSVTMEPHCALKVPEHLLKNKAHYHHNANDRFGLKTCRCGVNMCFLSGYGVVFG